MTARLTTGRLNLQPLVARSEIVEIAWRLMPGPSQLDHISRSAHKVQLSPQSEDRPCRRPRQRSEQLNQAVNDRLKLFRRGVVTDRVKNNDGDPQEVLRQEGI